MALTALLYTRDCEERRDGDRRPIAAESTLRDADARPHAVTLRDLSIDGCLVETTLAVAPGDPISVGLAGVGRRAATVVRADDGLIGCRFDAPLSPEDFAIAFERPTVIDGGFQGSPVAAAMPEPVVEKWHPALRITFLLGLSSALWSAILHIA